MHVHVLSVLFKSMCTRFLVGLAMQPFKKTTCEKIRFSICIKKYTIYSTSNHAFYPFNVFNTRNFVHSFVLEAKLAGASIFSLEKQTYIVKKIKTKKENKIFFCTWNVWRIGRGGVGAKFQWLGKWLGCIVVVDPFRPVDLKAWRNLENNAMSSLHKLLRNRPGGKGCRV